MPAFILPVSGNVRATSVVVPNFSILASVSPHMWDSRTGGYVERSEKSQINHPDFQHDTRLGKTFYYRRHNAFRDQERYNIMSRAQVLRQGTYYKYYTTTINVESNPLFHEDAAREVDRYFDLPVHMGFNPQNELYARFGIQFTTKQEVYVHMGLFLELNYESLRNAGVKPQCDPSEHNPIWYQRGYEEFRYYGYTASQIFPKAGDLMKLEFNNVLYQVDTVVDELPEYEYKWRKYWWKLYLDTALDNGKKISDDVINSPDQEHFIDHLLGRNSIGTSTDGQADENAKPTTSGYQFDVSSAIDELKKDVLFRPPEVNKCVEDVTNDPAYYACGNLLGQW